MRTTPARKSWTQPLPYIVSLVRDWLETVYEVIPLDELWERGVHAERQVPVAIEWRSVRFDEGFRADIIVENKVIIERKSVERITHAHKKQVLTYLKLTGMRLGYLLNSGEAMMKHGIARTVNGLPEEEAPWRPWRLCERRSGFEPVHTSDG